MDNVLVLGTAQILILLEHAWSDMKISTWYVGSLLTYAVAHPTTHFDSHIKITENMKDKSSQVNIMIMISPNALPTASMAFPAAQPQAALKLNSSPANSQWKRVLMLAYEPGSTAVTGTLKTIPSLSRADAAVPKSAKVLFPGSTASRRSRRAKLFL